MTLSRTPFKRPEYTPPPVAPLRRVERSGVYTRAANGSEPITKIEPCRSEAYRRLVAAMPCKRCGIVGHGQAAHPNSLGKGMAIKADDRLCFCLCADRPGVRGCHSEFDQGGTLPKEVRRKVEEAWGADTRRYLIAAGLWPVNLPRWKEA